MIFLSLTLSTTILSWLLMPQVGQWVMLVILLAVLGALWVYRAHRLVLVILVGFFVGYVSVQLQTSPHKIADACFENSMPWRGKIISIPQYSRGHMQFDFLVSEGSCHYTVRLSWYGFTPFLQVNDEWSLFIKIKSKTKPKNPGEFDYFFWLQTQGIDEKGYVINNSQNQLIHRSQSLFSIAIIRQKISFVIYHAVHQHVLAAILTALTIGSRYLLKPEDWQVFQNTGTSHLIAISGLHVSLVAGLFYWLTHFLWRLFPKLALQIAATKIAALIALFAALSYSILAGMSVPTLRALIMLTIVLLGKINHRAIFLWQRLVLSLTIVLMLWPIAALSISLWLSFFAVGMLGYLSNARLKIQQGILSWLTTQVTLFFALLPLTLLFFEKVSLVMIIANLVAIPYVSFIVVPCCLFATVGYFILPYGDSYLWILAAKSLAPLWWYLSTISSWPHILWVHGILRSWIFVSLLVSMGLWLVPKGFPGKKLAFIFSLPLFFYVPKALPPQCIQLIIFDVGREILILLATKNHLLRVVTKEPKEFQKHLIEFYRSHYLNKDIDALVDLSATTPVYRDAWQVDGMQMRWLRRHLLLEIRFSGKEIWILPQLTLSRIAKLEELPTKPDLVIYSTKQSAQKEAIVHQLYHSISKNIILSGTYKFGGLLPSNTSDTMQRGFYSTARNGSIIIWLSSDGVIQMLGNGYEN